MKQGLLGYVCKVKRGLREGKTLALCGICAKAQGRVSHPHMEVYLVFVVLES